MANDVTSWQRGPTRNNGENRNQNDQHTGDDIPGDTDAPDIVGRTGEEMPEAAHDDAAGAAPEGDVPRNPAR